MFTLKDVIDAHAQVKSGADFPAYIQVIKKLGVTHYVCFVEDGRIDYYGEEQQVNVPAKYPQLPINEKVTNEVFLKGLKDHQAGKTDFPTFINMAAQTGIDRWTIDIPRMTCTYFDRSDSVILEENIPSV